MPLELFLELIVFAVRRVILPKVLWIRVYKLMLSKRARKTQQRLGMGWLIRQKSLVQGILKLEVLNQIMDLIGKTSLGYMDWKLDLT